MQTALFQSHSTLPLLIVKVCSTRSYIFLSFFQRIILQSFITIYQVHTVRNGKPRANVKFVHDARQHRLWTSSPISNEKIIRKVGSGFHCEFYFEFDSAICHFEGILGVNLFLKIPSWFARKMSRVVVNTTKKHS